MTHARQACLPVSAGRQVSAVNKAGKGEPDNIVMAVL